MRVVTWNLLWRFGNWRERQPAIAVTLSSKNPLAPLAAVKQIDRRVDYILARPGTAGRPMTVRRAFLADTPVAGVYPSDHDAVVADLAHHARPCATGGDGEQ